KRRLVSKAPLVDHLNNFSVAQAFTPGYEKRVSFESPINGALIALPVSHPGVNAWATEKLTRLSGHHLIPRSVDVGPLGRFEISALNIQENRRDPVRAPPAGRVDETTARQR